MKKQDAETLLVLLEAIANSRVRTLETPDGSVRSELDGASIPHLKIAMNLLVNFVARLDGISVVDGERLEIVDLLDLRDARNELDANRWRFDEMRADEEMGFTRLGSWIFLAAAFLPIARKGTRVVLTIDKAPMIRPGKRKPSRTRRGSS